jgi:hypothetical protein
MRISTRGMKNAMIASPQKGTVFGGTALLNHATSNVILGKNNAKTKNHAAISVCSVSISAP